MTKISWRDANASDLKIEYEDGAMDNGILQPGRRARVGIMMKDAAKFYDMCSGSGRVKDLSIKCPVCSGSGFLNSNGQGISPEEVTRAMTTHHESARNGTFGSTDSNSQLNDHPVRDAEIRRAAAPHRAGWRIADQSRAHHARMNDEYSKLDDERENLWRGMPKDAKYTGPDSQMNVGQGSPARNVGKCPDEAATSDCEAAHKEYNDYITSQWKHDRRRRETTKEYDPFGREKATFVSEEDRNGKAEAATSDAALTLDQMKRNHDQRMQAEYETYARQQAEAYKTVR
jgi:hypothetical protein